MDRRKYLKTMAVSSIGAAVLLDSCDTKPKEAVKAPAEFTLDRTPAELEHERKLLSETFFDEHEMKTITQLADIIIPKDEVSGSASDAGVPQFIEFIVKDMPRHQTPMRGGLKWLDIQCAKRYDNAFIDCTGEQQMAMIDEIAFPEEAKPEMKQGVAFFNLMRDLTATGFFTSAIGIKDLDYRGNQPNKWNGVPQEVLEQYGMKYDDRTLEISAKYDA